MARRGDMQEVELLDGDEHVTEQPETPARSRRGPRWVAAGAVAVALSLVGTQWVVDSREAAAVARLASVAGVFPQLGDELVVVREMSSVEGYDLWSAIEIGDARTATLTVAPDGSQSVEAVDQRTGAALWSTPLVGPSTERAATRENGSGGRCQGDGGWEEASTLLVCLATDGFVRYGNETEERFPATTTRVVVLDSGDGHVVAEWAVAHGSRLAVVGDLAVVGTRDAQDGVVVVGHDVQTGDEQWRYREPVEAADVTPTEQQDWGLFTAGDAVALYDGDGYVVLSETGALVRDDLREAGQDAGLGTDPVTGQLMISTYGGSSPTTTTLLAPDADPAGDVVLQGEPVRVTVDDGSLPGLTLTYRGHAYAWDRRTGEQLWEAKVQPSYNALILRGRLYLTTSTEIAGLDGRTGEVLWRTPLPVSGQGMLATDGRDLMLLSSAYDDSGVGRVTVYDLGTGDETRTIEFPPGVSDIQLMHGLLVGWSYTTDGITVLE
ncbi:outer membrane protein assembly factor BamB family protein [Cellulomonas xylanilytica]|nr:PQQ-binding-like beta-propeller repeat protein [Cellulomonas xylanilytica]